MAKKIYAVRKGRKTGLFYSWEDCRAQVHGYSGPEYKGFTDIEEAKAFLGWPAGMPAEEKTAFPGCPASVTADEETAVAYVDGSYDKASGDFSCGMVFFYQGEEISFSERFSDRELAAMRNVAGEIKGAEAAMRYAKEHGIRRLVIYHDYEGIAKWCNGAWKTNKEGTKAYRAFYEEMAKGMEIRFEKVRGHSGDKYNDMADHLARQALGL